MIKHVCDRCGREIPDSLYYIRSREYYRYRFWFSRNQKERCQEVEHELCKDCQESLWHWWEEGNESRRFC